MFINTTKYYLAADIGGTKSLLAIIDERHNIRFRKIYQSSEIQVFTDIIKKFLQEPECRQHNVKTAVLAVAGPVNTDRTLAQLTNTAWNVDAKDIMRNTALKRVILLNDFEAIGFSIDSLKQGQYIELTAQGLGINGTVAVIGAGTGLGVSVLPYANGRHMPLPSEGGHVSIPFNMQDPLELKLAMYIKKYKLVNEAETLVSGRGLLNIYKFLLSQKLKHDKRVQYIISRAANDDKPALITRYALGDKDILCLRTIELFIRYYARIARNLALTTLCTQLVIAGGIAPKVLPALQDMFVEEFVQHDNTAMRKILELSGIIVLTDENIPLHGCLNAARYI
jgi:glucokinase